MGVLISTLIEQLFPSKPARILILGLDNAGKTTLMYKLKLGEVVTSIPTLGFNLETVKYKHISFTMWDVGFRGKMIPLWRHYYPGTDAIIFVVDSTDKERMDEARELISTILMNENLKTTPLLVFSNKVDKPNSENTTQVTDMLCLHKYKDREWFIQETCATAGEGLLDGLEWLANNIK